MAGLLSHDLSVINMSMQILAQESSVCLFIGSRLNMAIGVLENQLTTKQLND